MAINRWLSSGTVAAPSVRCPGFFNKPARSLSAECIPGIHPLTIQDKGDDIFRSESHCLVIMAAADVLPLIPLLIFVARIVETALETVRTIYIARGHANLAAFIGIIKTGIWLLSTGLVLTNLVDFFNIFAYLAGYGIGTLLGMEIEKMISLGHVIVRLITPDDPQPLIAELATKGYGMTRIEGTGSFSSTVSIIFMIVPRPELGRLLSLLSKEYPGVLYTVEDVRDVKEGARIFHKTGAGRFLSFFGL